MTGGRIGEAPKLSLWQRVRRIALTDVGALVRRMNAADLEALEQSLIESDFGVQATIDVVRVVEEEVRRGRLKTEDQLRQAVVDHLARMLEAPAIGAGSLVRPPEGPAVYLLVGVNGVGKTTTVAKLAARLKR
jgi:fused signal recognition particle receptor